MKYTSTDGKVFRLTETYLVDNDIWVRYVNEQGQEYTCRQPAFLARFSPQAE